MRISQKFKDVAKPQDIDPSQLISYLQNLYGSTLFNIADAIYVESPTDEFIAGYTRRANILVDELKKLSGIDEFEQLRAHFTTYASPGETRDIIDMMKKTAEAICCNLDHDQATTLEKFKAEVKSATLNACSPGAATNMQKILYAMNQSYYYDKYDFLQNIASEYSRSTYSGNHVHVVNELINALKDSYKLEAPKDVYSNYNKEYPAFCEHIDQMLASRKGVYSFVEFIANGHASKLPDAKIFPVSSEEINKITEVANDLKIATDMILDSSKDDGLTFSYKKDYLTTIKTATIKALQQDGMVDHIPLIIKSLEEIKTYAPLQRVVEDGKTKIIRDTTGTTTTVEKRDEVIESPDGWYQMKTAGGIASSYEPLLATSKLQDLTVDGGNPEDFLHENMQEHLTGGLYFHDAMRVILEKRGASYEEAMSIEDKLLLMSDQAETLLKFMPPKALLSMPVNDRARCGQFFAKNPTPDEILPFSIKNNNIPMLKISLERGANVNAQDKDGERPLHYAARNNNQEVVEFLINKGANVNLPDKYGDMPLHIAARNNNQEVVEFLINKGADVNAKGQSGRTTLLYAVGGRNKEMVELLIDKGADVNLPDESGKTPLQYVVHYFAEIGNKETVKLLINKGADVNAKDEYDNTLLHYAAVKGNKELVELLIDEGADVDAKGAYGFTPLLYAARNNNQEVSKFLIEQGADINAKDKDGFTPLQAAVQDGSMRIISTLLKAGSDLEVKINGKTAAELKPEFFTDEAILEIFKEAINDGDLNAIQNLDKAFPKFKEAIYGLSEFVEQKLNAPAIKAGSNEWRKAAAFAAYMIDQGFFDHLSQGENIDLNNKEPHRLATAARLGIKVMYSAFKLGSKTPDIVRNRSRESFASRLKEATGEGPGR